MAKVSPNVGVQPKVQPQTQPQVQTGRTDGSNIIKPNVPTISDIELARGDISSRQSYGSGGNWNAARAASEEARRLAAEEQERRRLEAIRIENENKRKAADAKRAEEQRQEQAERRQQAQTTPSQPIGLLGEGKRAKAQAKLANNQSGPSGDPILGHMWTTENPVSGHSYSHEVLPDSLSDDDLDDYYSFENDDGSWPIDNEDLSDIGEEGDYDRGPWRSLDDYANMQSTPYSFRAAKDPGDVTAAVLRHAKEVAERQRGVYDLGQSVRDKMDRFGLTQRFNDRRQTEIDKDSYIATPASSRRRTFEFPGDFTFEDRTYSSKLKDSEILGEMKRLAAERWDVSDVLRSITEDKDTSFIAQRNGSIEYDPESSIAENNKKVNETIESNAKLITNPDMIGWGSEFAEVVDRTKDSVTARRRFLNRKDMNVEGAIGAVRRYYGCSIRSVQILVIQRLGLGIDSNGKICGKDPDKFVLPDELIIEACNDIVAVAKKNGGYPIGINVDGIPYGINHTRDDTGMFPILGGTRCIPMGHIPMFVFEDISKDPNSPLHKVSERQFYTRCVESHINDVQPILLANTTGPAAWQAVAWFMGMEGHLLLDGFSREAYSLPEHIIDRTRAVIEAELMRAGDDDMRAAHEQRKKNRPIVLDRYAHQQFKDGGVRENGIDSEIPAGTIPGPGTKRRNGPVDGMFHTIASLAATARCAILQVMLSGPVEAAWNTGLQQAAITFQKASGAATSSVWHFGDRFKKSEYLRNVMSQDDAREAIDVYRTLFRIGGRTAVDAFRYDYNDEKTGPRYHANKKDLQDFLNRWGVTQGSEIQQRISNVMSFAMFGDKLFQGTKAQQFMDMALHEMMQNQLHGGEVLDAGMLEEIARSGERYAGSGEALVSALLDTSAGYEAFKTMDYTAMDRTTPMGRAVDAVLSKNGITELGFREMFCMFLRYRVGAISRAMPMSNTISYFMSNYIKWEADQIKVNKAFSRGFREAADAVSRISDYQVGMDSDFLVGLRKNLLYDVVMFGGNYIVLAGIQRAIFAMFGGIEPPEDEEKLTLPWEWKLKALGVPIKWAWFMDDLMGCGAPLAYAWEIADGYEYKDKDGIVRYVAPNSDEAIGTAWHAWKNMVRSFGASSYVIDAIDSVNNFTANFEELCGKDPWSVEAMGDALLNSIDTEMADYYGDDYSAKDVNEMRMEWLNARMMSIALDLFDEFTPKIINQVFPGSRDSLWSDKYVHDPRLEYSKDYERERAENELRTTNRSYQDYQLALKTQDNVLMALFADLFKARDADATGYQYSEMPIHTETDARYRGDNTPADAMALNLTLENGSDNLDLNNDGKTDTQEERQSYLFMRAENDVVDYIDEHYLSANKYPEYAAADGFVIPADARINAINYCYYMIGSKGRRGKIWDDFYARKEVEGFLDQSIYDAAEAEWNKYNTILQEYLKNDKIPWRAPRYAQLRSDTEAMYVDKDGKATDWTDPTARKVTYSYGNSFIPLAPIVLPNDQGNYDFQPFTWDTPLDEDGNPILDGTAERIYDQAAAAGTIIRGRDTGKQALDVMTAGGAIKRGDSPVPFDRRGWEVLEGTYPDWLKDPTKDVIDNMLGISCFIPGEEDELDDDTDDSSKATSASNRSGGGGSRYSRYRRGGGGYSYGGGRSSYASSYNPKIYSTSRNVYSQRAAGMSTRQPYKAATTYLRPAFYTKGSREAYRRQDF